MTEPFMPFFFGDFLAATAEWEGEERALYALLLAYQWSGGSLPSEPRKICKMVGYSWENFEPWWPTVGTKFIAREDARLINRRLELHRDKTKALSAKNSESGKKGAINRWKNHARKNGEKMADATPTDGARHENGRRTPEMRHAKIDGVTDGNPSHPIPSHPDPSQPVRSSSARDTRAREESVPRETGSEPEAPATAGVRHFGDALTRIGSTALAESANEWRSEPGINPTAMEAWLEHCARLEPPKIIRDHERLTLAKMLARQGNADAQMHLVEYCRGNGWRNIRFTDARPNGRASGRRSVEDYDRDSAARLAALPGDDPGEM